MKKALFATLFLLSLQASAFDITTPPNIKTLRQEMILAIEKPKLTDSLYIALEKMANKPPVIIGYIAMLEALKAKHAWNPYSKFNYLGKSKKTFQQAVAADPLNMEIRFMRFSVQHFLPSYLGYSKDLADDKTVIMKQLRKPITDKEYVRSVMKFLIESKRCTDTENQELNKKLKSLS